MILGLAIDTATEELCLGLARWDERPGDGSLEIVADAGFLAPRSALSRALPAVRDMVAGSGHRFDEIGCVVCGRGPGSFTGVRIGMSTAKGLAYGLGVPLYGIGTPEAVAWRHAGEEGLVGVVLDAMRKEVYATLFRSSNGVAERLEDYSVARPEEAAERWASSIRENVLLTGDGLAKYVGVFEKELGAKARVANPSAWSPSASALLTAFDYLPRGESQGDPGELLPVYTRLSDAEENELKREAGREADGGSPDRSGDAP